MTVTLLAALGLAACGPSPDYAEAPEEPTKSALPPEEPSAACRQAPPQQRMHGRMGRFRSVEGMGTLACPPSPLDPSRP